MRTHVLRGSRQHRVPPLSQSDDIRPLDEGAEVASKTRRDRPPSFPYRRERPPPGAPQVAPRSDVAPGVRRLRPSAWASVYRKMGARPDWGNEFLSSILQV